VANVSHELKTPLTSISGYAETLLGDSPDPETTHRFLNTILGNARRMQRLVDNLLDLARIESGHWQPQQEPVDLDGIAAETWSSLRDQSAAQTIQFSVELSPDAKTIHADFDALGQILTNLFDNAVRYTPPGGRIALRSKREGRGISIRVSDNGPGIPRDHLPRIFERFYRSDPSRSRDEGGTGLGLAIVKHLVEAHSGRVSAESGTGVGTTITCWFPDAPVTQQPA
jgi:signal transduction histidine kinase